MKFHKCISLLSLGLALSSISFADPVSSNYRVRWAAFDNGAVTGTSPSYSVKGSVAQTSPVTLASSTGFIVRTGIVSVPDTDADSVLDFLDNCVLVENSNQFNGNAAIDRFGNACDADLNNDGFVGFPDLGLFKAAFGTADANADLNSDGFVGFPDLGLFKSMFGLQPGPSGLPVP